MPFKKKKYKNVIELSKKQVLSSAGIEFNREVRKKLTYEYLGIWTGTLRNTTGALLINNVLYFGTDTGYGLGYETRDWSKANVYGNKSFLRKNGYAGKSYYQYKKENPRKASWIGDKRHRPFLIDTIMDKEVTANIVERVKRYAR